MPVIKNAKAMYAHVVEKDSYQDKYIVTLANLTDEQCAELKANGMKIQHCDREGESNRGRYVRPKSQFQPPVTLGKDKKVHEGYIGDGSIINVSYTVKPGTNPGMYLNKIHVVELVEYTPSKSSDADSDDLFDDSFMQEQTAKMDGEIKL